MYDNSTKTSAQRDRTPRTAGGSAGIAFVLLGIVVLLAVLGWLFFGTTDGTQPVGDPTATEPAATGTADGTSGTTGGTSGGELPEAGATTAPEQGTAPADGGTAAPAD